MIEVTGRLIPEAGKLIVAVLVSGHKASPEQRAAMLALEASLCPPKDDGESQEP